MSVETGLIGVSTGLASGGISSGGQSLEIGNTPSVSFGTMENFSAPSFNSEVSDFNGGGFVSNLTAESLFSQTVPYVASEGRSFDKLIGSPDAIFSQKTDFVTIAESVKSSKTDSIDGLFKETIPFVPTSESFSERVSLQDAREILGDSLNKSSRDLQEGEWVSVSKTKSEDLFKDFKPLEPHAPSLDRKFDIDLSKLEVVAINQTPEQELKTPDQPQKVASEIKEEDAAQAQRVVDALIPLGTSKDEATQQVLEIVRKMNRKDENIGQIVVEELDTEKEEKVKPKVLTQQAAVVPNVAQIENDQEEEDEEDMLKKEKPILKKNEKKQPKPVLEVDNSAQGSRKTALKARISEAFKIAREKGLNVVKGRDVVQGLTEKREDKSQLLIQAGLDEVPDGSFHEVVDEVANLEVKDTSLMGEAYARIMINFIVDGKPAVRVSKTGTSKPASQEDEKRVTKFVNSLTTSPH